MLKKNAQLFEGLFTATDLVVVSVAWILSYWVRFSLEIIPAEKGVPLFSDYLRVLIFVWLIWAYVFRKFGLYRPMRGMNRLREVWLVVRANSFAVLLFLAVTYLFREKSVPFSRLVFVIFWCLSTFMMVGSRTLIRNILREMRKRGYNLRYALIVGAGDLAAKVARQVRGHPEYGVSLLGCLASDDARPTVSFRHDGDSGTTVPIPLRLAPTNSVITAQATGAGAVALRAPREDKAAMVSFKPRRSLRIIGTYSQLPEILARGGVDQLIVALPLADHDKLESVISSIGDSIVDVKIVPDFHQFIQLGSLVEEFDGLPVMSLTSTPLSGINRVIKRGFDLLFGIIFLLLAAPIIAVAALLVKLTSRGPVFYSQERVGLDGIKFNIIKIRSMYVDAEAGGARFSTKRDPRVTPIGRLLRRTNIDELPQLINVIRGQMSLVGPRPERPVFIDEFRRHIPKYMLRHKVQAGMTGWAQINGWRGDSSIEKRIEHDLYYIEHWSLAFDIKILLLTLIQGFRDRSA